MSTPSLAPFYSLTCKTLKGVPFSFDVLKGKVVIVVNVASKCGFTSQYTGLEALYQKYKNEGLEIIGFPSNEFGSQEPGSAEEIQTFCSRNYAVSFPIMEKIETNGDHTHPVYAYLKGQKSSFFMSRIKWNFEKFVINRKGEVVSRHLSTETPEGMETGIKTLLAESA